METGVECDFDESIAGRYVAGRLAEAEAEAFEAHYFGCDRCWRVVRAAQELRGALELEPARGQRTLLARPWVPLAAAAALLIALGTWMRVRQPGAEQVFRAPRGAELALTASARETAVSVSWSPVPNARGYRARVVTAAGGLVTEQELPAPPLLLAKQRLPDALLYVTVQALGPDRQVLVSSAPLQLPPRR
jgi:hypothetical protein